MSKNSTFSSQDNDFTKLARKARRKTYIRTFLISLFVSLLVIFSLYTLTQYRLRIVNDYMTRIEGRWDLIQGANINGAESTISFNLLSYNKSTSYNKILSNKPVPWKKVTRSYNVFGKQRTVPGGGIRGYGPIVSGRMQMYLDGNRVLDFYHPFNEYHSLANDFQLLDKISDDKILEIAVSFTKSISIDEVKNIFKDDRLAWLWVNTETKEEVQRKQKEQYGDFDYVVSGEQAIGFQKDAEGNFINALKFLSEKESSQYEISKVINNITNKNSEELSVDNLEINGVVLTGSPSELKEYIDIPIIRASTLGVITERY
ncbi:anti sigma factor C-terminal domain-containing protein [Bacillus sp. CGMCC 1.16607]|uniref:anti sigma factor C-terminal domain-containing protein n=1 Tax=Bacillus sp. CGMCC 1.16607 TaxID=3351842 RepID=UPI00362558B8